MGDKKTAAAAAPTPATLAARCLKLLAMAVCLGWLMLWIMMPTMTYRMEWSPSISEKTSSTYLGKSQGGYMLVFVFPILFVAVVGCVYVHLRQRRRDRGIERRSGDGWTASWGRPFMVRGPLGIVSYGEFAFFVMFVALLVWYFTMAIHVSLSGSRALASRLGETLAQTKLMLVGHRLGLVGNVCLAFLFFPVTRASSILPLFGVTSEASVRYHIWMGHVTMAILTAHGLSYFFYWAAIGDRKAVIEWPNVGIANVPGELSLLFGVALWATTFPRIRRKMFEVFFYTHQLYTLFLLFYFMHVSFTLICTILPGVYLFVLDRYLRFLQSRNHVRTVSARLLPGDNIELNFAKSPECYYTAGSVVFVNIPRLSRLQWHPFTVNSSCSLEPERLSVIMKREGKWTQRLHELLASSSVDRLDVSLEGPYGPTSNTFLRYNSLVLISGGSGITPFVSFIRELLHLTTAASSPLPDSVHLICAFKTSADLAMLDLLLPPDLASSRGDLLSRLRIDAFVTREHLPPSSPTDIPGIRFVSFRPSASDLPLHPILGRDSWLWLAAVIASSFVAYLLMLGLLYRFYVYPIDRNSNKVFTYAGKAMFNLFFICLSIAGCAGAAVLLNKRRRTVRDGNRVANMAKSRGASPGVWPADQELESFPVESVTKATSVHYGQRPNLKKMLMECNEPNTGVFVSGPTSMRREVAAALSSGMFDNLHFESVSFSW